MAVKIGFNGCAVNLCSTVDCDWSSVHTPVAHVESCAVIERNMLNLAND